MKKPRIQSPLDRLPLHQKQTLMAWLTTGGSDGRGLTYRAAQAKLKADFGVQIGVAALCGFYQRHQRAPLNPVNVSASPDGTHLTVTINLRNLAQQ